MTVGSLSPCRSQPPASEIIQLRQDSLRSVESVDLTFTDSSGRSYQLSVERQTSFDALTYDRSARLSPGGGPGSREAAKEMREGFKERKEDLKELRGDMQDLRKGLARGGRKDLAEGLEGIDRALRDASAEVNAFKKLLHRFLKAADRGYADHYRGADRLEEEFARFEEEHLQVLNVSQTVNVTLEVTGGGLPDEWSVENTAGRLVDFAMGLFRGGDRSAHSEKMAGAMEKGYREAEGAFGGALPEIARKTVDLARELLDRWARPTEVEAPQSAGFEHVA